METDVLELDHPNWKAYVDAQPDAGPFHHPAWARLLADCYGHRAFAITARDDSRQIVGGVPVIERRGLRTRRWVTLPYTDSCPPLGERRIVAIGIDEMRRALGISSAEIRGEVAGTSGTYVVRGVTHTLPLDADLEALRRRFDGNVRRNIAKSQREGVDVRVGTASADLLDTFYRLHLATRARQGVPIQPRRFFELLWERLLARGLGFVAVADHGGRAVAAAVFLEWKGRIVYKFGASDTSSRASRPNDAIFWHVIERGCRNGSLALDLGRSDLDNVGLRRFKSGWGAAEEELRYLTYGAHARGNRRALDALSLIIRSSPDWVCRRLGEHLYRYAG